MTRNTKRFDRRRFIGMAGAATVAGLAGCTNDGDGDSEDGNDTGGGNDTEEDLDGNESENESDESNEGGNETEDDNETDGAEDDGNETVNESEEEAGRTEIVLFVENEDGEPVAEGVSIMIDPVEETEGGEITYTVESEEALEGGEYEQPIDPGNYLITAEGDAFETVEREVTVEEGETVEVTLTLEGAPAEGEGGEEESDGADGEGNESEDAENETADESEGDGNESADNETENETVEDDGE